MTDKKQSSNTSLDPTRMMLLSAGKVFCIIATAIAIMVLMSRLFNAEFLLKITPGKEYFQNPLTSFCFIIIGVSLWVLRNNSKSNKLQRIVSYFPLLVSFIGLARLVDIILGIYFNLDILFFKKQLLISIEGGDGIVWNEMSPNAGFSFLLLGITIFFIDTNSDRIKRTMQVLNYLVILIALLSIYGYIYEVRYLYSVLKEVPMTFYTGVCFFLFSSAVLFLRPDRGSMHVLIGENPQEVITLRFIAIVLPLFFGWIKIQGEGAGLYGEEFGTAIFAVANFIIVMVFLGRKSKVQYKLRKAKAKIHEIIKEDNERLRKILDFSPTQIGIYDLESDRAVYLNSLKDLNSSAAKSFLDISILDYMKNNVHKDDLPKVLDRLENYKSLKDNEYSSLTYRLYRPDGEIIWLHSRAMVYKRVEGKVTQVLTNSIDITEQKRIEEELLESKKYIEKVTNASANIIYIFDLEEYKNIYVNKNIETILGYSSKEIELFGSELFYFLTHPEDIEKVGKYHAEFKNAKEDEVREVEYRMKNKSGNWNWLYSRDAAFLRNEKGEVKQIVGIAHDMTKRKEDELKLRQKNRELSLAYEELHKAQQELKKLNSELEETINRRTKEIQETQERYRSYINQSNEGIWRYEFREISYIDTELPAEEQAKLILKHAYVAECNDRMASIHGYNSGRELIGIVPSDFLVMTEEAKLELAASFVRSGYFISDIESVQVIKNGDHRHFRTSLIGIVEDGKLIRCWGTKQDITDQKLVELALKASEERYHYMVDRIPEIFWCADDQGNVQYYNQKWFDYTGENDKHKLIEWRLYVHSDDVNRILDLWNDCILNDKECCAEYRLRRFDGVYRWHLIKATPIKNVEGEVVAWMSTSTDIHKQKIYRDELKSKNKTLAKITHDASDNLQDTLSSIEDLISVREDSVFESDKHKEENALKTTKKSVDKLKKIVTNISEADDLRK